MTPVGFEPTPFRNGALSHRLRPLGQSVRCKEAIIKRFTAVWTVNGNDAKLEPFLARCKLRQKTCCAISGY